MSSTPQDSFKLERYARPAGGAGSDERRPRRPLDGAVGKLFDRLPPHSLEAEMALLGSMILDPRVIVDVIGVVTRPEDFYAAAHAQIFRAITEVHDAHHSGDLVQILELLRDRGVLEDIGGAEYLEKLAASVPSAVNAPHYAGIVAEKAKLRRLIDAAGQILYDAYHVGDFGPEGAREVIDQAEVAVFEIAQEEERSDPQRLADLLQREVDRIEAMEGKGYSGVPTGFTDLDDLLLGLQPGEMIIVAARPSMGKTALALNMAEQIALGGAAPGSAGRGAPAGCPVGFFSLEMSKSAVAQRLLSARSGVGSQVLRGGAKINDADFRRLMLACDQLRAAPIYVDDMPGLTVMQLRARARRMVAQHAVKAIMVDYLQLLTAPAAARESRQVEVSAISRGIKGLARELNVPIVCLSQLNRGPEQREGNRPRMSDLRESGSIEQDADVVILLHREEYYHLHDPDWAAEHPDKAGVAELIVAKQRNGPTGTVELTWDNRTTRFRNHAARRDAGDAWPFEGGARETKPGPRAGGTPRAGFTPAAPTGPIADFRDGGGPERELDDDDTGGIPL